MKYIEIICVTHHCIQNNTLMTNFRGLQNHYNSETKKNLMKLKVTLKIDYSYAFPLHTQLHSNYCFQG